MNQLLPLSHPIAPPVTDVFIFIFSLQIATCVQMTYVVEIVLSFILVLMQLFFYFILDLDLLWRKGNFLYLALSDLDLTKEWIK